MPKQSKFIVEMQDKFLNAGLQTGKQIAADVFEIAMHDCGINPAKIAEVAQHALDMTPECERALMARQDPEADVIRDKMDKRLKAIFKEKFNPWEERYPWIKKVRY